MSDSIPAPGAQTVPEPRNVSQQHKLAKDLLHAALSGDAKAIARFRAYFPGDSAFQLSGAQLVVAREAKFENWNKLIERAQVMERHEATTLVFRGHVDSLRKRLENSEYLRSTINSPTGDFGAMYLHTATTTSNTAMIDLLLEYGADPNAKTDWRNGPYTVLDNADEATAGHLVSRGAKLTPHVAARLGWIDELRPMLDRDPSLVHERGGDGKMPLHDAKSTEIVDLLLERGAEIDARCVDHHSTSAMYALKKRPEVCRHLIARGAQADLYQAAFLGDVELAKRLIDEDPSALGSRINLPGYAPVPPFCIYCWTLDWYLSPLQAARLGKQQGTIDLLESRLEPRHRLVDFAWYADELGVEAILKEHPEVLSKVDASQHALLAAAAHLNRPPVVKVMIRFGFDVNARANDNGTALHQACWIGSAEMVEMLLATGRCLLNDRNDHHQCTPIGWAAYGSVHCGHGPREYEKVIRMMAAAGVDLKQPGNLKGGTIAGMAKGNPKIEKLLIELGAG